MSKEMYTYECMSCRKTSRVEKDGPIPCCCGNLMQRIDSAKKPKEEKNKPENGNHSGKCDDQ